MTTETATLAPLIVNVALVVRSVTSAREDTIFMLMASHAWLVHRTVFAVLTLKAVQNARRDIIYMQMETPAQLVLLTVSTVIGMDPVPPVNLVTRNILPAAAEFV